MAAFVLAVATLVCQASAQLCNGPILTQSILQSLPSSPVSQISQIVPIVSVFPTGNSLLPTITQIPANIPDLPQPSSISPISNCLFPFPSDFLDKPISISSNLLTNPNPVISTTVVDNSVANSLANVLQLLIVSEFLESSFTPPISPSLSNILPLYDAIGTIGTVVSPLDAIAPVVDVTTVSFNPVVDVSTIVTEVIAPIPPVVTSVVDVPVPVPVTAYAPVTEIVAPAPNPGVIAPIISTPTEVTSSISPTADVYTTITDSVPVSPVASPVPYFGVPSAPTYITEVTDIIAPKISLAPTAPISYISDYYSGYADVITPVPLTVPFAAELILPKSIPAQIVCNFGYSPVNMPVLSMNVETLAPSGGYFF